jgi:hypothetical protein
VWSAQRPGRFTPGKDPVPIVQEAGWDPGPVWTCAKNLAPIRIRSPDRPARSQSLYRLSYPPRTVCHTYKIYQLNKHTMFPHYYLLRIKSIQRICFICFPLALRHNTVQGIIIHEIVTLTQRRNTVGGTPM